MPNEIPKDVFDHLVELAALELSPEEAEYLHRELNNQLISIEQLAAIPLEDDTETTSHGVPYTPEISPPIREDAWQPYPDPDAILEQAPETEDRYVVVPEIPHEELA